LSAIFISYRRDDAPGYAGRLYDRLRQEFGRENVFIDVDALQPGDDFVDAIHERLAKCDLMLVVIGPRWLSVSDAQGRKRLEDEGDYVRIEVQQALARRLRTVPVLVERGTMPRPQDLPEPLRALARRQGIELSDTRWEFDVGRLVESLKRGTAPSSSQEQLPAQGGERPSEEDVRAVADQQAAAVPHRLASARERPEFTEPENEAPGAVEVDEEDIASSRPATDVRADVSPDATSSAGEVSVNSMVAGLDAATVERLSADRLSGESQPLRQPASPQSRKWFAAILLFVAASITILIWFKWQSRSTVDPSRPATAHVPDARDDSQRTRSPAKKPAEQSALDSSPSQWLTTEEGLRIADRPRIVRVANPLVHRSLVKNIAFSPDDRLLAVALFNGQLAIWNASKLSVFDPNGELLQTLSTSKGGYTDVAFSPDGSTVIFASDNGGVSGWDTASWSRKRWENDSLSKEPARAVAFSPDGRTLAVGSCSNSPLSLFEAITGIRRRTLESKGCTYSVAFSPDGAFTAAAMTQDSSVTLFSVRSGGRVRVLGNHKGHVSQIAYSPSGDTIASVGHDGLLRVWNLHGGRPAQTFVRSEVKDPPPWANSVDFAPDGRRLAVGYDDGAAVLWDVRTTTAIARISLTGTPIDTFANALRDRVDAIRFSRNGKRLAVSAGNSVTVWELRTP
jgi:WD40 repeat protein